MNYTPALSRESQRDLRQSSTAVRARLTRRIQQLPADPFATNISKALHGPLEGMRSSRVGELRIIYEVVQDRLVISVIRIGPRGDIYRG